MSFGASTNYQTVLQAVQAWPTPMRISLMQDILKSVQTDVVAEPPSEIPSTFYQAVGLLKGDRPLSDEDVERILEQERAKKYQ